jgi:hypothetical protein
VKAIIVHNCATSAYTKGLKALFPEWEVRGVISTLAYQWLIEVPPKTDFMNYLSDCAVLVSCAPADRKILPRMRPSARYVEIPPFGFLGLQPDCFHLNGFVSVLGMGGSLYSRLIVAAFQAGLSQEKTCSLFTESVYRSFGYLDKFESEVAELVLRYEKAGIDLSSSVPRWLSRGNFVYSYNHPRVDVLLEILWRALVAGGFLPPSELDDERELGVSDDLKESIRWPIYPEIARRHGLPGSLIWRMGRSDGYRTFDALQFVAATYEALAQKTLSHSPDLVGAKERLESIETLALTL